MATAHCILHESTRSATLRAPLTVMVPDGDPADHLITQLLADCNAGSQVAEEKLLAAVYQQLRHLAGHHMQRERPGHTLQTTALVHEAYLRLFRKEIDWQSRAHFF